MAGLFRNDGITPVDLCRALCGDRPDRIACADHMADDDLDAKQREVLELLAGQCAAPERHELRIAALRALLEEVREQTKARDQGRD